MMSEYLPVLARRSEKWSRLLKENTKVDKNLKGRLGGPPHRASFYCHTIFFLTAAYTHYSLMIYPYTLVTESLHVHYWQWRGMWGKASPANTVLLSGWLPVEPSIICRWTLVITSLSWRFTMTPRWKRLYAQVSRNLFSFRREMLLISQEFESVYLKPALTRSYHLPDLHRTFPDNIQFHDSSQPCLLKALYNVLVAYGHHNKDVGYCQVQCYYTNSLLDLLPQCRYSLCLLFLLVVFNKVFTSSLIGV